MGPSTPHMVSAAPCAWLSPPQRACRGLFKMPPSRCNMPQASPAQSVHVPHGTDAGRHEVVRLCDLGLPGATTQRWSGWLAWRGGGKGARLEGAGPVVARSPWCGRVDHVGRAAAAADWRLPAAPMMPRRALPRLNTHINAHRCHPRQEPCGPALRWLLAQVVCG